MKAGLAKAKRLGQPMLQRLFRCVVAIRVDLFRKPEDRSHRRKRDRSPERTHQSARAYTLNGITMHKAVFVKA